MEEPYRNQEKRVCDQEIEERSRDEDTSCQKKKASLSEMVRENSYRKTKYDTRKRRDCRDQSDKCLVCTKGRGIKRKNRVL